MSVKCPKCGTEIEQDFGIVTCSNCTSIFSVDVDGNTQLASEEFHQNTQAMPASESPAAEPIVQEFEPLTEQVSAQESTPEEPLQFATEIEPEPEVTKTWAVPKDTFQEIRDFGNKEASAGPITYAITIEDLNVAERIEAVLEALSDPRFGWEASTLSKKIKSGTMKLKDLNPAVAVMVIKKLRGIHVKVSWTQNLYS